MNIDQMTYDERQQVDEDLLAAWVEISDLHAKLEDLTEEHDEAVLRHEAMVDAIHEVRDDLATQRFSLEALPRTPREESLYVSMQATLSRLGDVCDW